jgi:hypothetical protein
MLMTDYRYPIGHFQPPDKLTIRIRRQPWTILRPCRRSCGPRRSDLRDEQLDTPYRPGGWTVRQLVHHVADSHMNSYIRFRLALTEYEPDHQDVQREGVG